MIITNYFGVYLAGQQECADVLPGIVVSGPNEFQPVTDFDRAVQISRIPGDSDLWTYTQKNKLIKKRYNRRYCCGYGGQGGRLPDKFYSGFQNSTGKTGNPHYTGVCEKRKKSPIRFNTKFSRHVQLKKKKNTRMVVGGGRITIAD